MQDGKSVMADRDASPASNLHPPMLSDVAEAFLSGVLNHLPAMCMLTTPSNNSYHRLEPGCWAGAFCIWGWDNKEVRTNGLTVWGRVG